MNGTAGQDSTGESVDPNHFVVIQAEYGELTAQITSHQAASVELRLEGVNPGSELIDQTHGVMLKHEHDFNSDMSSILSVSTAYKKQNRTASEIAWLFLSQYDWNAEMGLKYTGIQSHLIQAGVQFVYEDNLHSFFHDVGENKQLLYDEDTHGLGFYIDDHYSYNEKLTLIGGVRVDHNTLVDKDKLYGGRIAGVLQATDIWTSKLLYNRTNRLPSPMSSLNQLWGFNKPNAPVWATGSPNAKKAEQLATIKWGNSLSLEKVHLFLNLYHQELKDFITWGSPHSNVGDFEGNGLEFSLIYQLSDEVSLWGNAAYNN